MENITQLRGKIEALKRGLTDLQGEDPKLSNPFYLAHWLHANKYDVGRSAQAVRANRQWRRANGIDAMADTEPDDRFTSHFPFFDDVKGNNGRPVMYYQGALVDLAGLIKEYGRDRTLLHMAHFMVKTEKAVFEWENRWFEGADEETATMRLNALAHECGAFYIIDVEHLTVQKAASPQLVKLFVDWARMGAEYFPNNAHVFHIINTSKLVPFQLFNPIVRSKGISVVTYPNGAGVEKLQTIFSVIQPKQLHELQERAKKLCNYGGSSVGSSH